MAKQIYYPLSKIDKDHRDIALIELENAQKASLSQSKIYTQFASVLIGLSTVILAVLNLEKVNIKGKINSETLLIMTLVLYVMGLILLRYFVDLQKEITINSRKVVTLRSMLGLDYSSVQLTLPKDRVEGATNPFNIKLFTGWFKFQSSPVWILTFLIGLIWTLIFYKIDIHSMKRNELVIINQINPIWLSGLIVIIISYFLSYRISLFDRHENIALHISIFIAFIFRIKFFQNFEYSLYRARLSYYDLKNSKIEFENLKKAIVTIEDGRFYKHKGVDWKSLFRGVLSQNSYIRRRKNWLPSGGSTIEMQLARTIFIPTNQNKYKRKLLEFFVAFWLSSVLEKEDIIKIYVGSVRFGHGIMGLKQAMLYYFGMKKLKNVIQLPLEYSFVLAERLSNITNTVDVNRIQSLLRKFPYLNKDIVEGIYNNNVIRKFKHEPISID
ncbi:biosynthetic peptidoglycan transglycosylase [Sphingobacterium spiritivorum]|uniref:biosynthetic peptidoglycan transglycosylase n=1 Tax=Sphingobacterium spiritivorum TaxID=258 RepID=UPI003DA4BFE3